MKINLNINGSDKAFNIAPGDNLLQTLRSEGYFGVKHGCESGECGACTVLLDGKPVNTCVTSAAQAEGKKIETIDRTACRRRVEDCFSISTMVQAYEKVYVNIFQIEQEKV